MSRYPYIDRNPCIVAAGKSFGNPRETVKSLLQNVTLPCKINAIKQELGFLDSKKFCADNLKRPDVDTSGAFTEIRHCIRKPEPTQFEAMDEEIRSTIYDSYWNKAVGKTRDPTPGLPTGMRPLEVTFGSRPLPREPAGLIINPPRKAEEIEIEDLFYHDLYACTHQNYYPGEQIRKNYTEPFSHYSAHGKVIRSEKSGERVKRCLTWFNNDPLSNVSRRLAAVRNRTLPPLGKGLDKTGVTDLVPANHTYGAPSPAGFYGVEDLLNQCQPSLLRRDMLTFLAYANQLRHLISKKINLEEIELEELYDEILSLNEGQENNMQNCSVHFDWIEKIMRKHGIYLDRSKLEPLLLMLGLLTQDFQIDVKAFINFIDKNSSFPDIKKEHFILPVEYQNCQEIDSECQISKDICEISNMPRAGRPTIQMNPTVPYFEDCTVYIDHLGQETNARALISPSIYTQYGLSHRDFFKPRSKSFLGNLFRKINVDLSEEELDELYQKGYALDNTGGVCIETFRNLLDECAYKEYNKYVK